MNGWRDEAPVLLEVPFDQGAEAQRRKIRATHGGKGRWARMPEGLKFPIAQEYVTVSRLAAEGAIGAMTYGGVLYYVHSSLENRKP